ncbi:helix-turn-helix domain-containing protein [Actinokineospora globicatena]|uniref:helix-turn-helix domain-containing protein n=1 Tax=Actinokineospora globicatena TaxID=103729 RepID=UPI0020A5C211|nr:helix-turn-helix transcriptional regulator [Actinokineospora globicatena]MCP2305049.1 Helix-turn-helix domain-containing protein [Actinokineospora globicatena]GLW80514.1 transcriptional regulator [Actinokineospora globicatena]GLW87342.1 transcriptional regulator [Actinokineospora globicatena]
MAATPTRRKKRLGRYLRELREAAGLRAVDAARKLKTEESTISRYENGIYKPAWAAVSVLLTYYGAGDDAEEKASALYDAASVTMPKIRLPADSPKAFRELVNTEREAEQIYILETSVIPGLLQTADYAMAVFATAKVTSDVDELVNIRLERQRYLEGPDAIELCVCLDIAVLHREVGGRKVLRDQLQRLLDLIEQPNVTVHIIPFETGAYGNMSGGCWIMTFGDEGDSDVVYLEHPAGGVWVENESDVQHFQTMFDEVRTASLDPEASAEVIRARVRSLSK